MELESNAVQEPMLKYLQQIGWEYIEPKDCNELRGGIQGLVLLPIFRKKLKQLNEGVIETDKDVEEVLQKFEFIRDNLRGNKEVLDYLRGNKTFYVEDEDREMNIRFFDYENPENNEFHCTKELTYKDIKEDRADIVLFINGFPVIIVETKPPTTDDAIEEAFAQISRYHEEIPEFMKVVQLYSLSDGLKLRYGSVWKMQNEDKIAQELTAIHGKVNKALDELHAIQEEMKDD